MKRLLCRNVKRIYSSPEREMHVNRKQRVVEKPATLHERNNLPPPPRKLLFSASVGQIAPMATVTQTQLSPASPIQSGSSFMDKPVNMPVPSPGHERFSPAQPTVNDPDAHDISSGQANRDQDSEDTITATTSVTVSDIDATSPVSQVQNTPVASQQSKQGLSG
jgi:hypothetical protein